MVQTVQKLQKNYIKVNDTQDLEEIRGVLRELLQQPNLQVKENIIKSLLTYLKSKFEIFDYKIKVFIVYYNDVSCGMVISDLNPEYKSYGRKCGTFGWLIVQSQEICEILLKQCEVFVKENRLRKIRGPINFPKMRQDLDYRLLETMNKPYMVWLPVMRIPISMTTLLI